MPDALDIVARDLAVLAAGDRRAILRALDRADRDRLAAALRGEPRSRPERVGEPHHSLWFESLIATARTGNDRVMTPTTAAALLDALGTTSETRNGATDAPNGRSLLEAAGGLLGRGRAR